MSATYEVGLLVATERPDVERRGTLELIEAPVGCLCMFIVLEATEDCLEWGTGEYDVRFCG